MLLENRSALHLLRWMRERGFEFRSGFSHPDSDHVIRRYIDHCLSEDASRQGSAENGGEKDTGEEDQDRPRGN